jgi:hypothetical protein
MRRVGRNRRDVAQRLHETLTGASAPLLGVVANSFKSRRLGGYGYRVLLRPGRRQDDGRASSGARGGEDGLAAVAWRGVRSFDVLQLAGLEAPGSGLRYRSQE